MNCTFSFCFGQIDKLPANSLTCQITVEGSNLTLTGQQENVMATRTEILNSFPTKIHLNLKIPDQDCNKLREECDKIAIETNTIISVTEPIPQSSFASQNTVNILISGIPNNAELARIQTLVMLDKQSQLVVDTIRFPYKLHHIICGRKRTGLQSILEETATSIYFPSPFVFEATNIKNDDDLSSIYITGESKEIVARAKEMLTQLVNEKPNSVYQKEALLHPRKLDWMLLHHRNDLRKIMRDNGSFVSFPKMGSGNTLLTVFAESRVNAERTLRSLHFLACDIYEACFYFSRDNPIYGVENAHAFFPTIADIQVLVAQLSQISGAEVCYKADPGCIEVYGTERSIRSVYQKLHEMLPLKLFHHSAAFNVELSNDQREFISGKKSGKINKIMKTSGAKIKFVPFSEYNFIIEVESNSFNKALDGLTLLQEELPAEISFYVPEIYHKRIIGVGGKNIQRIMKKYGVYVKFSNAEEFAALGGYYDNEDNVVARTPMKNQINLDNLRHAVMDLINPKDRDCVEQVLHDVPFYLHRTLIRDQAAYLADMTKKTNTHIIWPDNEMASDSLILVGPESQVGLAAQMVKAIVPEEYNVHLPYSTHLKSILKSKSFQKEIVEYLALKYQITVEWKDIKNDEKQNDEIIALKMTKGNLNCVNMCLEILIGYLKSQQVNLYDDSTIIRNAPLNGFIPAALNPPHNNNNNNNNNNNTHFPIFDSKLLPNDFASLTPSSSSSLLTDFPIPVPAVMSNNGLKSYSLFDYPGSTSGNALDASWKNFRDITSPRTVENIRAIFDSPETNKPLHPPSLSIVSPLSFRGGPPTSPNGVDIWSNPPQQVSLGGFVNSPPLSGIESKPHSMMYSMDQSNNSNGSNAFYQPLAVKSDFNTYVAPTSSTSTGSNNSSMHSSQSVPDIMLEERQQHQNLHTPPKKSTHLPFSINNYNHTQTPLPPLIYPSTSTATTNSSNMPPTLGANPSNSTSTISAQEQHFAALSSSASVHTNTTTATCVPATTPSTIASVSAANLSASLKGPSTITAASVISNNNDKNLRTSALAENKSLEFPALFSINHSSADETVIVQSLLNNMSIGQPNKLTH